MITVTCDICNLEPKEPNYTCEVITHKIVNNLISGQKEVNKDIKQVCKTCNEGKLIKLFKKDVKK